MSNDSSRAVRRRSEETFDERIGERPKLVETAERAARDKMYAEVETSTDRRPVKLSRAEQAAELRRQPLEVGENNRYKIQRSDSLWTMAERRLRTDGESHDPRSVYSEQKRLQKLNQKEFRSLRSNPDYLRDGWELQIYDGKVKPKKAGEPTVGDNADPGAAKVVAPLDTTKKVVPGQTDAAVVDPLKKKAGEDGAQTPAPDMVQTKVKNPAEVKNQDGTVTLPNGEKLPAPAAVVADVPAVKDQSRLLNAADAASNPAPVITPEGQVVAKTRDAVVTPIVSAPEAAQAAEAGVIGTQAERPVVALPEIPVALAEHPAVSAPHDTSVVAAPIETLAVSTGKEIPVVANPVEVPEVAIEPVKIPAVATSKEIPAVSAHEEIHAIAAEPAEVSAVAAASKVVLADSAVTNVSPVLTQAQVVPAPEAIAAVQHQDVVVAVPVVTAPADVAKATGEVTPADAAFANGAADLARIAQGLPPNVPADVPVGLPPDLQAIPFMRNYPYTFGSEMVRPGLVPWLPSAADGTASKFPILSQMGNFPVFRAEAAKPFGPPLETADQDPDYKSKITWVPNILPFLPLVAVETGEGKSAHRFRWPFDGQPSNLDPVKDPAITGKVPDATYIGYYGDIRTWNKKDKSLELHKGEAYWLSKPAAYALEEANKILSEKGKSVDIYGMNSAGRMLSQQEAIRYGKTARVSAKPGNSRHELGRAIDIRNYGDSDVRAALKEVGFVWGNAFGRGRPIKNDPFHFSFRDDKFAAFADKHKGETPELAQFKDAKGPDKASRIAADREHARSHRHGRRGHSHNDEHNHGRRRNREDDDEQPRRGRRRRH